MRLVLVTFTLALVVGYLCRGRLSSLANLKVRWAPLAFVGLALQFAPLPGQAWPMAMLYLSFALLFAFAIVNLKVAGFPLMVLGSPPWIAKTRPFLSFTILWNLVPS